MIIPTIKSSVNPLTRSLSTSASLNRHVAVLGAAGGIGQPLSYALKMNPTVSKLSLYDVRGAPGVAADLSHIPTFAEVKGYATADLKASLKGAEIVLIPAGVPRKPGMTRDDLFNTNASIVRDLVTAISTECPKAMICVIANPVNSTVPIAAEVLKKAGVYNKSRLFGVTTLDVLRSSTFVSALAGSNPSATEVTVIGGHAGTTIIPLLSQSKEGSAISGEQYDKLVHRIMFGGDEVVQAKDGAGSATLSMAAAAAQFTEKLIAGMDGVKNVVTPAYVESPLYTSEGVDFFASNVRLGPNGAEEIIEVGKLSSAEEKFLAAALPELKKQIAKGVSFIKN